MAALEPQPDWRCFVVWRDSVRLCVYPLCGLLLENV